MFQALEQIKKRFFDKNKGKAMAKKQGGKAKWRVVVDRIYVMGSELNGKMRVFKRKRACLESCSV